MIQPFQSSINAYVEHQVCSFHLPEGYSRIIPGLLVTVMILILGLIVYITGGTTFFYSHLMYVPIILAAFFYRTPGGIISGILAGIVIGFIPLNVSAGLLQPLTDRFFRTAMFTLTGTVVGYLFHLLSQRLHFINEMNDALSFTYASTLQSFAKVLSEKDTHTSGHCERVAYNASLIGKKMGLDKDHIEALFWTGMLHDLGKISIPESILLKPGRLTPEEYAVVKNHSAVGAEIILAASSNFKEIAAGIRSHHERWDGSGYPDGLARTSIPVFGRILSVADVFEALTSKRPYREPLPQHDALKYIKENSGAAFDPEIVSIFEHLFYNGQLAQSGHGPQVKIPQKVSAKLFLNKTKAS